jgi:hypothetical protein
MADREPLSEQEDMDRRINAAIEQAGVSPELAEWYGGGRVVIRLEVMMGRYVEGVLTSDMTDGHMVCVLERLGRDVGDAEE